MIAAGILRGSGRASRGFLPAFFLSAVLCASASEAAGSKESVRTGADVLLSDSIHLLAGKRAGVVCNRASVLRDGSHILEAMRRHSVGASAVFSPEHGFDGSAEAGSPVPDMRLEGLRVWSLYGAARKPSRAMLRGIDLLVFDLQDVGVRYYTYVSTLALCMEAAAENGIPIVVLDRPNPINGLTVEGPVLDTALRSFVGMFPVPVRHGMTIAEMALMIAGEKWIRGADMLDLRIVPMAQWRRDMWFESTGLRWIPPSPNMRSVDAALAYAGVCLLEGTAISEGRGTEEPFLLFGAPFLDASILTDELNAARLPGARFERVAFVPVAEPGASRPKYEGRECRGARLVIVDRDSFRSFDVGVALLRRISRLAPDEWGPGPYLDTLAGVRGFRQALDAEHAAGEEAREQAALRTFADARSRYLIASYRQ